MLIKLINLWYAILGLYSHKKRHHKETNGRNGYYKLVFSKAWLDIKPLCGYGRWLNTDKKISEWEFDIEYNGNVLSLKENKDFCMIEVIKPWEPLTEDME